MSDAPHWIDAAYRAWDGCAMRELPQLAEELLERLPVAKLVEVAHVAINRELTSRAILDHAGALSRNLARSAVHNVVAELGNPSGIGASYRDEYLESSEALSNAGVPYTDKTGRHLSLAERVKCLASMRPMVVYEKGPKP